MWGITSMRDLIAKIEAATGPDRVLDGDIWIAINGWQERDGCRIPDGVWHRQDPNDRIAFEAPPAFTASIDAAVSLVPDGHWWIAGNPTTDIPQASATVRRNGSDMADALVLFGATPALVICAAALRVRLAMQDAGDA